MNTPPRVALVGCGRFAREVHVPALRRLEKCNAIEIVGVCGQTQNSIDIVKKLLGKNDLKQYIDLNMVLSEKDIDIVDLVLPPEAMPGAIRSFLYAGKHVISERPIASGIEIGQQLIEHHGSLENPPFWMIVENWKYKRFVHIIEQVVRSDEIGGIRFADFNYMTFAEPYDATFKNLAPYSSDVLACSGIEYVSLLREVVGDIDQLSASVSQRLPHFPPADSISALLSFAGGMEGCFRLSLAGRPGDKEHVLTIVGSRGTLTADFHCRTIRVRGVAGERLIRVPDDLSGSGEVYPFLESCIRTITADGSVRSNAEEALSNVAVFEAMCVSSQTNSRVRPGSLCTLTDRRSHLLKTFGCVQAFRPSRIAYCQSIQDVCSAVRDARRDRLRIRVMGNGYSWAPHVVTRDVCIKLVGLNRIIEIDRDRKTVRAEAGVRLADLTRSLSAHGLTLPSLSFVNDATLGGVIATGTHGTSPRWGTLSDFVTSITLVLPSGEVRTIGPDDPPEELRAAKVSVGMLGVIVEIELQAIEMPWVRYDEQGMTLSNFEAAQPAILDRYEHLWVHWTLGQDKVVLKYFELSRAERKGFRRYVTGDNAYWMGARTLVRATRGMRKVLRRLTAPITTRVGYLKDQQSTLDAKRVWMSMQYSVPLSQAKLAIERIRTSQFARSNAGRTLELKFLKGTADAYLGPNAGEDAISFNVWWNVDEDCKFTALEEFELLMQSLHAKPHWGKLHTRPRVDYLQLAYPQWAEFEKMRKRLDPHGMFSIFETDDPDQSVPAKTLEAAL